MATVGEIAEEIRQVAARLAQQLANFGWPQDQPLSNYMGAPSTTMTGEDFRDYAELVAKRVERLTRPQLDADAFGPWLGRIAQRLPALQFSSLNQGHVIQFNNALSMLQMIDTAIPPIPPRDPKVNWEDLKGEKGLLPKDLAARLRSIDARLKDLEPRSKDVGKKIADIESAHATADQLPTDLAELQEKREELQELIANAQKLAEEIGESSELAHAAREKLEEDIKAAQEKIDQTSDSARVILDKSEQALRGATAVGLSKAFEARKQVLSRAGFWWTISLALALIIALAIGWERVTALKEVLSGDKSAAVIVVNGILALFGIGAPVWFAWLATKQISTTFRLAEDYAFKASVAQAYEGYRTEAVEIDEQMRTRLFASALDRFEEAPIRLVDPHHHSSPLQEMLGNPALRAALERVPNIAEKIVALIPTKAGAVAAVAAPAAAATALASAAAQNLEGQRQHDDPKDEE